MWHDLDPLFADDTVDEIMITAGAVWVERHGRIEPLPIRLTIDRVAEVIEQIVGPAGLRVDRASPMVDVRLPDGSRANVVVPPVAVDGACITIRRFAPVAIAPAEFGPAAAESLRLAVEQRRTIVISGATGSGKTTLLNALIGLVAPDERLVTIEETAELRPRHPHVARLEARLANTEGVGEVSLGQLVRNSLRMRPDRIIVGEVRGVEIVDMIDAMNTGHAGSMSTCHANSAPEAVERLETMAQRAGLAATVAGRLIRSSIDLVVHVARHGEGAARRVVSIVDVDNDCAELLS